jgi:predicted Zn-dependent protease
VRLKRVTLRRRIVPRRRRKLRPIELIPAGGVDRGLLDDVGHALQAELGVQWWIGDALPLREEWREAESGLYRSIHLIHALMDRIEAGEGKRGRTWRLAIADAGLCAEGVGRVFGEAAVEGCCAVVGIGPLQAGSGADGQVLRARLLTEAVHEVGHLAGVGHCRRASCVMYSSLHIADSDHKGHTFCAECRRTLNLRGLQES